MVSFEFESGRSIQCLVRNDGCGLFISNPNLATDQKVKCKRYLSGQTVGSKPDGIWYEWILKITCSSSILIYRVMVFVFFQFFFFRRYVFNKGPTDNLRQSEYAGEIEKPREGIMVANSKKSKGFLYRAIAAIEQEDVAKRNSIKEQLKSLKSEQNENPGRSQNLDSYQCRCGELVIRIMVFIDLLMATFRGDSPDYSSQWFFRQQCHHASWSSMPGLDSYSWFV